MEVGKLIMREGFLNYIVENVLHFYHIILIILYIILLIIPREFPL